MIFGNHSRGLEKSRNDPESDRKVVTGGHRSGQTGCRVVRSPEKSCKVIQSESGVS
jgi:hypothetical protein